MQASSPTIAYNIHQYPVRTRPQDMALSHRKRDAINYTIHPETVFPMSWVWSCFTHIILIKALLLMNLNNMLWCFFVNVSICFYHFHSCSTSFLLIEVSAALGFLGRLGRLISPGMAQVRIMRMPRSTAVAPSWNPKAPQIPTKFHDVPWFYHGHNTQSLSHQDWCYNVVLKDDRSNVTKDFWMTPLCSTEGVLATICSRCGATVKWQDAMCHVPTISVESQGAAFLMPLLNVDLNFDT